MLNAKDLTSRGVPAHIANGFVTVNFGHHTNDPLAEGLVLQTPGIGGANPGERDNPTGTESYPNDPRFPTGPGATTANSPEGSTDGPGSGAPPIDWKAYLADWGFPPDVVNELDRIFKQYTDVNQAQGAALAYIRGTDWYKTTFAGIGAGIKNGLVADESGYRSYVNQLNQVYRRYYGRDVTSAEVSQSLTAGQAVSAVDAHLQGGAFIAANKSDIQYTLGAFDPNGKASDDQLAAYGDHLAGLQNMIGPQLQLRLDKARQRLQTVFQGTEASPALNVLNNGRIAATSLGRGTPDLGA